MTAVPCPGRDAMVDREAVAVAVDRTEHGLATASPARSAALITQLTRSLQVELAATADLRRQLAKRDSHDAQVRTRIERLETDLARADEDLARLERLHAICEGRILALVSDRDAARQVSADHQTLVATLVGHRSWRAGRVRRRLRRLWARSMAYILPRRELVGHFAEAWFARTYPEVGMLEADPFDHFMTYGLRRGLDPNRFFAMRWYLLRYPDVAGAGMHPLLHFQRHGLREGRTPHPDVSCFDYRQRFESGSLGSEQGLT